MARVRRTWREKLADAKDFPKVGKVKPGDRKTWGLKEGDTIVIPAPHEVNALMRLVPVGQITTIPELQRALARKHGTTTSCPICTGIFAWIAAHAAEEDRADGKTRITPYWRTLKVKGEINPKFPGGVAACAKLLRAEGHKIVRKGERRFVADFEKVTTSFPEITSAPAPKRSLRARRTPR